MRCDARGVKEQFLVSVFVPTRGAAVIATTIALSYLEAFDRLPRFAGLSPIAKTELSVYFSPLFEISAIQAQSSSVFRDCSSSFQSCDGCSHVNAKSALNRYP